MITAVAFGLVGVAALFTWCVSILMRRRSRRRLASSVVEIDGTPTRLDVATWSVAAVVGADRVAGALLAASPKDALDAARQLHGVTSSLTDDERAQVAGRVETGERARAERALWDVQTESIINAAGVGMLDTLILATGEHADWAIDLIDRSLEHVDVSRTVIEHALSNHYTHYWGLFHSSLLEHATTSIDNVAGHAIDAGVNMGLEGASHTLSAIADAHLPVITIFRSVHRASKSSQAGLDSARVGENLALDLGLKGGGFVGGAALGTAIFPGVGTVIGGLLGGLLGAGAAESAKERHLRVALERADELNEVLGASITLRRWRQVAATLGRHRASLANEQSALAAAATESKRGAVPSVAHYVLTAAAIVGAVETAEVSREYEDWRTELEECWDPEAAAFRGVFALTRPDLHGRLQLDPQLTRDAMSAHEKVDEERNQLALAGG